MQQEKQKTNNLKLKIIKKLQFRKHKRKKLLRKKIKAIHKTKTIPKFDYKEKKTRFNDKNNYKFNLPQIRRKFITLKLKNKFILKKNAIKVEKKPTIQVIVYKEYLKKKSKFKLFLSCNKYLKNIGGRHFDLKKNNAKIRKRAKLFFSQIKKIRKFIFKHKPYLYKERKNIKNNKFLKKQLKMKKKLKRKKRRIIRRHKKRKLRKILIKKNLLKNNLKKRFATKFNKPRYKLLMAAFTLRNSYKRRFKNRKRDKKKKLNLKKKLKKKINWNKKYFGIFFKKIKRM